MDRLERLVAIVLHLQSRRVIRAEDLAEHFDVSVRTVYRDLRALEEAGVPVSAEAGKGYSLVEGYHLPPVMFTEEEASALFMGGEFADLLADASLKKHARSALMKIRAVLPADRREFVERLQEATAIRIRRASYPDRENQNLDEIQHAIAYRKVMRIVYRGGSTDEVTTREVEPLGLVYYADHWHMIGHCRLRDGIRDFRTDRVGGMDILDETFPDRHEFSIRAHLEGIDRGGDATTPVVIRFRKNAAKFTTDRHFFGFVEETAVEEGVEMRFEAPSFIRIVGWVMSFGTAAEIISPPELRRMVRDISTAIADRYNATESSPRNFS